MGTTGVDPLPGAREVSLAVEGVKGSPSGNSDVGVAPVGVISSVNVTVVSKLSQP